MRSFTYRVGGLTVCFDKPILGLLESADAQGDVFVHLIKRESNFSSDGPQSLHYVSIRQNSKGEPQFTVWLLHESNYLRWTCQDGTEFVIDDSGSTVWATWPNSSNVYRTVIYFLGPILSYILRLRGRMILHGSAFVEEDGVIAIIGESRSGKSTTVAALAILGYPVVTDDILILDNIGDTFKVTPSYPNLRLWPRSVDLLFDGSRKLTEITPTCEMKILQLNNGLQFETHRLLLKAIYSLDKRQGDLDLPQIESMAPQQAFLKLVQHRLVSPLILGRQAQIEDFDFISRLSTHIPIRQVTPTNNIQEVHALAQAILKDFASLPTMD